MKKTLALLFSVLLLPVLSFGQASGPALNVPIILNNYGLGAYTDVLNQLPRPIIGLDDSNVVRIDYGGSGARFGGNVTVDGTLTATGGFTPSGRILAPNGTAAAPSYSFVTQPATGMYLAASSTIGLSISGTNNVSFTPTSFFINSNSATLAMGASADVVLARDAANTLSQQNGNNPQVFRMYGNSTGNPATSAYGQFTANADGSITILNGNGSASTSNSLNLNTTLLPTTDNFRVIGAINQRFLGIYGTGYHSGASAMTFATSSGDLTALSIGTNGTSTFGISGSNAIVALGSASANNASLIQLLGSNSATNWQIDANSQSGGKLSFTPSTGGGGSTFTTSVVNISTTYFGTTVAVGANTSGTNGTALNTAGTIYASGLASVSSALSGAICISSANQIEVNTNAGGCLVSSERFKNSLVEMNHGWDWLSQMQPYSWEWNDASIKQPKMGAGTAEKMAAIDPSLATFDDDGRPYSLNDRGILGVVINAIKEQQVQIEALKAKLPQ